ncbi:MULTISPECIES: response regulator [unclassified Methylobacterium]|uniref:response regulator n=1 Tax=unclassified Methylobacterium TaxID=2615210 RepID=UPI00226A5B4C|nr:MULTISPECIES: response regulator [unclassified Methylobacterium]
MSCPATVSLLGRSILVVEDEYLIATEVMHWLQETGAEVVGPVPRVDRALDLVEDHRLDAAVLDINLGDGDNSFPIADRLEMLWVPYLFATGHGAKAKAAGYTDPPVLVKPYSKADLLRTLMDLIAASARPAGP